MNRIKTAFAKKRGIFHEIQNTECQDNINVYKNESISVIALSDGAGSVLHSEIASKQIVEWTVRFLCNDFESIFEGLDCNYEETIRSFVYEAREQLRKCSIALEECCCTLLAVAINKDGDWIALHIGDGAIFCIEEADINVLSPPQNGAYGNETYFINENDADEYLRGYVGHSSGKKGFLLTSDGCMNVLYDQYENTIAEAVSIMIEWIFNEDEDTVTQRIERGLNDLFSRHSDDDLSIGVIAISDENMDSQLY